MNSELQFRLEESKLGEELDVDIKTNIQEFSLSVYIIHVHQQHAMGYY